MNGQNLNFPLLFDARGRTATTDASAHIRQMVEELLLTAPGERVNRPGFGSGLMEFVFGPNSPDVAAALQVSVQAALQQWLGDVIQLQAVQVVSEESTLSVTVSYVVKATGEQQVQVVQR